MIELRLIVRELLILEVSNTARQAVSRVALAKKESGRVLELAELSSAIRLGFLGHLEGGVSASSERQVVIRLGSSGHLEGDVSASSERQVEIH